MNHRKLFILANGTLLKQGDSAAQTPLPHLLFSTQNPQMFPGNEDSGVLLRAWGSTLQPRLQWILAVPQGAVAPGQLTKLHEFFGSLSQLGAKLFQKKRRKGNKKKKKNKHYLLNISGFRNPFPGQSKLVPEPGWMKVTGQCSARRAAGAWTSLALCGGSQERETVHRSETETCYSGTNKSAGKLMEGHLRHPSPHPMMSTHSAEPQSSPFPWFSLYFSTQCSRIRFLLRNAFLAMQPFAQLCAEQLGMGERGCQCQTPTLSTAPWPWAVSNPLRSPPPWSQPGVRQAAGAARGPHLPCSAPRARQVPPDTQEWMRGSGNRGRSSTLEERETLWLQKEHCQLPKPPPGTTPDPRLPHACSRHTGCQHALGCCCQCWGSCRQLILKNIKISSSPSLSPPAPSPTQRNCCLSQQRFQIMG